MRLPGLNIIVWGLTHKRIAIKVYTVCYLIWSLLILAAMLAGLVEGSLNIASFIFGFIIMVFIPGTPLIFFYFKEQSETVQPSEFSTALKLDPYLVSAKEKIAAMEKYFKGETAVSWSPIISLAHDAAMSILQRLLIDHKGAEGVSIIEQMRRERQLYLQRLAKMLKDDGVIDEEEFKGLELLRDLRNRVVHEDYHPSKEQALWALDLVKRLIRAHYPSAA